VSSLQPTIIPRSEHIVSRKWISPNALRVLYRLKEAGKYAYLVGGGVRDLLLGREPKDFDIVTDATPGEIKKLFKNCRLIGRRFRLAHIHFHDEIIEVATFRSNSTEDPEEKTPVQVAPVRAVPVEPDGNPRQAGTLDAERPKPPRMLKSEDGMILRDNVFGTPEEDALRRDFTVNALFYSIADFSVVDYVGGMQDLRRGFIRIIGDPEVRFIEDPVRMVRAVRFAAMLGFEIETKTYSAMLALKENIAFASSARMYEEVLKLFLLGEGEKTYQLLRKTGLFGAIFPRLNAWVDTEADGFPHIWIGKALEWVDAIVQSGRQVPPHILFALFFGQYAEEKAVILRRSGIAPLDAITRGVMEVFAEQTPRVQIPKKVGLAMRDIYWNQSRFEKREGKYPRYFLRRPGFVDAYEYLRFFSHATGEKKEICAWWQEFIKANPPAPSDAKQEKRGIKPPAKPRNKKRRRRPRNKPGERNPTQ
jgi:poly(A) polymerase